MAYIMLLQIIGVIMKTKMSHCYQAFKNGEISLEECRNQVITLVFKNQNYFQIQNLQSDLQSNLIIFLYKSIDSILLKYNPQFGNFNTYLAATIKGLKTRCFREFYRKKATELISFEYYHTIFQEKMNQNYCVSSLAESENLYAQKNNLNDTILIKECTDYLPKKKYKHISVSQKILILTLKSSYYLDDATLQKIAEYTKFPEKKLEDICNKIRQLLEPRRLKYKEKMEQINKEYLIKNRCFLELSYQNKGSYAYENKLKAYRFHKTRWNKMLQNKPKPSYLCPKNREISAFLDVSEDQVHYVLHKCKTKGNSQKLLKTVLFEYDNICSNRKSQ